MNKKIPLDYFLKSNSEAELKKLVVNARGRLPEGKSFRVLFLEADKPRSVPQHKYYRFLLGRFEKDTGNDAKLFHEEMKRKFGFTMLAINGDSYESQISTTIMTSVEMTDFIDKVRNFLREFFDYDTPDPKQIPDHIYAEMIKNDKDY